MKNTNDSESEKIKLIEVKIKKLRNDLSYHKHMVTKTIVELENTKKELKKIKAESMIF